MLTPFWNSNVISQINMEGTYTYLEEGTSPYLNHLKDIKL